MKTGLPGLRNKALLRGRSHYWTGEPCKHGHVAFRFTVNGACMECRRVDQYARWQKRKALKELKCDLT